MRLFRRRRKFGRQVVKVEVDPGEVDALIDDRELLAVAVTAYFSDAKMPYSAQPQGTCKRAHIAGMAK